MKAPKLGYVFLLLFLGTIFSFSLTPINSHVRMDGVVNASTNG